MLRDGRVDLLFGGDERSFRLGLDQLFALEDAADASLGEIASRLSLQRWKLRDVRETLRLGLIGGGMEPGPAKALVNEHFGPGRLMRAAFVARVVIGAALAGEEEDPKQAKKPATRRKSREANASPRASSSGPARSSGSPRKRSGA